MLQHVTSAAENNVILIESEDNQRTEMSSAKYYSV